jgi:hypothetical protein
MVLVQFLNYKNSSQLLPQMTHHINDENFQFNLSEFHINHVNSPSKM